MKADLKVQGDRENRKVYAIAGGAVIRVFDWNPEAEEWKDVFFRVCGEVLGGKGGER